MTTPADNERTYRRILERIWAGEGFDFVDDLMAEDCVYHDVTYPDPISGRDGMREYLESFVPAIDGDVEIDQVVADDDWIASRFTVRGTHVGDLMGIPATNEDVAATGMEMVRFEDGMAAEGWQVFDVFGLLRQIGAVPADPADLAMAAGDD